MYKRLRKFVSIITAMVSLMAVIPPSLVSAAVEEQNTVLQGDSYSLPDTILDKTVVWDVDTTTVDTSCIGVQKFNGTIDSEEVVYTLNVGKISEEELFTADMQDYEIKAKPTYKDSPKYLNVQTGTATVQYDDTNENKVLEFESGSSLVNVLYNYNNTTQPYGGYAGEYSVKGKIKLDLASISDFSTWNGKYLFNILAGYGKQLTTNLNSNGGLLGGVAIRSYIQESTGKIKLFALPSTNYSVYSDSVSITNEKWIESTGWFDIDFELKYFNDKTFAVYVNGIKITSGIAINDQYTKTSVGINQLQIRNSNTSTASYTIDDVIFSSLSTVTPTGLPEKLTDTVVKNSNGNITKAITLSLSNGDTFTANAYYTVDTSIVGVQTVYARIDGFTDTVPVEVTVEVAQNERYVNVTEGKTATSKNNPSRAPRAVDGIVTANTSEYPPYSYLSTAQENGQWWQVDLGEVMPISAVKLVSSLATKEESMRNFEIRISETEDFLEYDVIATCGGSAYGIPGESFVRALQAPKSGRYIRVYKTSDEIFRIDEFKAYSLQNINRDVTPDEPVTAFAVVGDVHSSVERIGAVMEKAYELYPELGAVVVNGDMINDGTRAELVEITDAIVNLVSGTDTKYILTRGNHDRNDSSMTAEEKDDMWTEVTGQDINQNVVIADKVRFITIGNAANGGYDAASVAWLEQQLEQSASETPEMPVFVCIHYPVASTFLSAEIEDNNKTAAFNEVLNKYPMVTVIGSHVHKPLYSEDIIWQNNNFTAVQTSALKGVIPSTLYTDAASDSSLSYCLFFEVDAAGVVSIYRYDVTNEKFIGKPYIYKPGDFSTYKYTDDRELRSKIPAFSVGTEIMPISINSTSIEIAFPNASDDEGVEAYAATVTNLLGEVVAKAYVADKAQIYSSTADNTLVIGGLEPETDYTVSVAPIDYFHIWGEAIICQITTQKANKDGNVARGKPVTASHNQDFAQYLTDGIIDGAKLDDGETYSWWKANSGVECPNAVIDLGYECDIESVVLVTRKNSEGGILHTANITLELSNDPEFSEGNYIAIGTTPPTGMEYNKDFVVKLTDSANYRYVRAIKYSGDNYVAIPEIEVYTKDNKLKPEILRINTEGKNVTSVTLRADTTVTYNAVLLVAVYDDEDRLINVVVKNNYKPVRNSSEQTVNISGVTIEDDQYATAMLWDDLNNIRPQMNAISR